MPKPNKKITLACIPPPPIMFLVLLWLNKFLIVANILLFTALFALVLKKVRGKENLNPKEKIIFLTFAGFFFIYNITTNIFSYFYGITESNYGVFYGFLAILFFILSFTFRKFKFKKLFNVFIGITIIFLLISILAINSEKLEKFFSPNKNVPQEKSLEVIVQQEVYCGEQPIF